ncbi:class v pyridoxal phosphate dependent, putative [Ichthyophthirius multifiliis]|uniref:Class v pyridoxal phosphate dependent, putative n=1 Tax=Ichthyophthirius multifiliis TaxID=5932 RepID=G0R4U6_ICHMU|nr:class v pyridoxal phosphate dependent, putative [Ichthyophthirius multifiliis]EGR27489.1 class v pyridoxal phosphate dependent, putative [Ichthyophthirius multifiliis]|eukprot:XP_004024399.1 class v pyridoxal phosphate dependent, putative [Ichthyophthirius multifiliis]
MQFGKKLLSEFPLDQKQLNINHGSYGVEPLVIQQKRQKYIEMINKNPDQWFRFKLENKIQKCRQTLSNYINCDLEDLVFSRNATTAFSDVLNSIDWNQDDIVLHTNIIYVNINNQLKYLSQKRGIKLIEVNLTKELLNNHDQLLEFIEQIIQKNKKIKAFIFDHISSVPALIFPVQRLSLLCKEYKIISICDGAHCVGQIKLNLKEIDVDFYFSNLHKWLFTPRSFAFLYVNKKNQKNAFPAVIGYYYIQNSFAEKFYQQGTTDLSVYLTVRDALEYRKQLGEEEIINHNRQLAWKVGQIVKDIWQSELLIDKKNQLVV